MGAFTNQEKCTQKATVTAKYVIDFIIRISIIAVAYRNMKEINHVVLFIIHTLFEATLKQLA